MKTRSELKDEIQKIKEQNARVEVDKAWETSSTRRITIAIFVYLFSAAIFFSINAPSPFVIALIPMIAFLFSIEAFPILKNFWIKNIYKKWEYGGKT